ncbi:MAG: DUF4234 domain-containing protein [Eubacterium sp.]|nr:DUF4234 domain-containing protein [Eubacterium sp.]
MGTVKNRNLLLFIILNTITVGIYGIVAFCIMSKEVNEICEGDGKNTMFYLWAWLLGAVTLGIFPLIWFYKTMERLKDNGYRYGVNVKHSGGEFLLWFLLGSFIAVGPIVALCYFVSDVNQFSEYVGVICPKRYSANPIERLEIEREPFPGLDEHYGNGYQEGYGYGDGYGGYNDGYGYQDGGYGDGGYIGDGYGAYPDDGGTVVENAVGNVMWLNGDYTGYTFPVNPGVETIIGKDPKQCNIVIGKEHATVSRRHAGIQYDPANRLYILTDYSSNGTFINDGAQTKRIESGMPTYLEPGKIVSIGNGENSFKLV